MSEKDRLRKAKERAENLVREIREEREKQVQLRVGDARQRDVGRGIARLDQRTMRKLEISAGDVIEMVGKRATSAIAWPAYSEDQNQGIIRIDGPTRKNARVTINKYVIVRPAKVRNALNATLTSVDMRLNVDEDFTNFVKNRLMERTFCKGDTTLVIMLGHAIPFKVVNINPEGIVRITHETDLIILPSIEVVELAHPIKAKIASFDELNDLGIEIKVLEKQYLIIYKRVKLKTAISVKFKDLEQVVTFNTYLGEKTKLSDVLHDYERKASCELEAVKADIQKRCDRIGFPLTISLLDIGKRVVQRIDEFTDQ